MPISVAVKVLYGLLFSGMGCFAAYISIYYRDMGLSGKEIGLIYSCSALIGILSQPFWGLQVDKRGRSKDVLLLCAVMAGIFSTSIVWARTFPHFLILMALAACFSPGIGSLIDSLTFRELKEQGRHLYANYRIWGTIAFMVSAILIGRISDKFGGIQINFVVYGFFMALFAISTMLFLHEKRIVPHPGQKKIPGWDSVKQILRQREFVMFLICVFLCRVAEASVMMFFGPYIKTFGRGNTLVGTVWMVANTSEILFFLLAPRLMARWGAAKFILAGFAAMALRWGLMSLPLTVPLMLAIQTLHGLTFGALFIGSVTFVDLVIPPHLKATGQTLSAALGGGLGSIVGATIGGYLFDLVGLKRLYFCSSMLFLVVTILFFILIEKG